MQVRPFRPTLRAVAVLVSTVVLGMSLSVPASAAPDRTPPTAPTNLRVVGVTNTTATIAWDPSTDNVSGVSTYTVCPAGTGSCTRVGRLTTVATITGLRPAIAVPVVAYATDYAGNNSGWSTPVIATTTSDTPAPSKPGNLTVLGSTTSTVQLRWTPSTGEGLIVYDVLVNGVVTPNAMSTVAAGTFPRPSLAGAIVRQLDASTTHTFTVRARATSGRVSGESNSVTATTGPGSADTLAPSTPMLLSANDGGDGSCPAELWASWTASTDNSGFVEYELRSNNTILEVVRSAGTITYTEIEGYQQVTVVAVDRDGNASAPSNAIGVNAQYNPCGT